MKLEVQSSAYAEQMPFDQSSNRIDAFLVLRAFACLMVVMSHCVPPRNVIIYQGYDLSWLLFSNGIVAVLIFFVLSGYLMGKAFYSGRYTIDPKGVLSFWRNRALRILPLYYFTVLIVSIFVYPEALRISSWGVLLRVCTFTYQPYVASPLLNFDLSLWSLSTEVQFYLLAPFAYSFFRRFIKKQTHVYLAAFLILLASFAIRCLLWSTFHQELVAHDEYIFRYIRAPLVTNLDLFLCGFLVNAWYQLRGDDRHNGSSKPAKPQRFKLKFFSVQGLQVFAIALVVGLYFLTAHHLYHQELWNLPERGITGQRTFATVALLQPLTIIIIVFFIAAFEWHNYQTHQKQEKRSFKVILRHPLKVLEWFGILSYGVYVWHLPILMRIFSIFPSDVPVEAFYNRLVATLMLSLVLAATSYYLIESPAARWKLYQPK